jgi:hypothetical protein
MVAPAYSKENIPFKPDEVRRVCTKEETPERRNGAFVLYELTP